MSALARAGVAARARPRAKSRCFLPSPIEPRPLQKAYRERPSRNARSSPAGAWRLQPSAARRSSYSNLEARQPGCLLWGLADGARRPRPARGSKRGDALRATPVLRSRPGGLARTAGPFPGAGSVRLARAKPAICRLDVTASASRRGRRAVRRTAPGWSGPSRPAGPLPALVENKSRSANSGLG